MLVLYSTSDKRVVDVVCGYTHSAAVCENGDVYCWGETSGGECGTGKEDPVITPEKVEFGDSSADQSGVRIKQVACGLNHTLALSYNGEIWAWGSGIQLGVKDVTVATRPVLVDRLIGRTVLAVCCGEKHSVALVERVTTPPETPHSSRGSKPNLTANDDDVSTCAACNEEIFSFTETLDTCIISDKHKCLIESEMSPTEFSATALPHSCSRGKKTSSQSPAKEKPAAAPATNVGGNDTRPSPMKSTSRDSIKEELPDRAPPSVTEKPREATPMKEKAAAEEVPGSPVDTVDSSEQNDAAGSQNDNKLKETEGNGEQIQLFGDKESVSAEADDAQKPSSNSPEEDVDIWKLRPEFEAKGEKTLPSPLSPHASSSKSEGLVKVEGSGSAANVGKISRSGSTLIDKSKARKYLAKQLEEGDTMDEKQEKTKSAQPAPPDSPSLSAFESMFSSTMVSSMQQVTSITSKAFSNIRSFVSGTPSDIDNVEKAIGEDLSHTSNEKDGASASGSSDSVAESSFINSADDSSSVMTKSTGSLNLSPETPRRSFPTSSEGDSPAQSDTRRHSSVLQGQHLTAQKNTSTQIDHGKCIARS